MTETYAPNDTVSVISGGFKGCAGCILQREGEFYYLRLDFNERGQPFDRFARTLIHPNRLEKLECNGGNR